MKWAYSGVYLCQTIWNHTKNSMKRIKRPTSVVLQGEVSSVMSSLLKTWKTRETKTWITQHFELVWPIQGRPMLKSTSWAFRICVTHRALDDLSPSYLLSKLGQIQKKILLGWRRYEKKTRPQYWVLGSETNSRAFSHGLEDLLFVSGLKTHYCGRVFFS